MRKIGLLLIGIVIVSTDLLSNIPEIGFSLTPPDSIIFSNDSLRGDFNGDGKIETLYVTSNGCIDEEIPETCICTLSFSNKLPSIKMVESVGAELYYLGDLNNDGADEFGYLRIGYEDWQKYHVFTLRNNVWVTLVPPFDVYLDYFYKKGLVPVEIDKNKKGYVIIRSCKMSEPEPIIITKSVKVI